MRSKAIAYILWCLCFIGICGAHRLYLGKIGTGVLQLFTLGGLYIWQFIDLFTIPEMVDAANSAKTSSIQQSQVNNQQVVVNISKDLLKDDTN